MTIDADTKSSARPRRRGGRPPADRAGEVDRRILDAATTLFLRQGYDATSCDLVVAEAGAGKASLYARYANKEALFAAVVRDMVDRTLLPSVDLPSDAPASERLRRVGHTLLAHALAPDAVALMRVVLTTAHRMPELARLVDRIGRDGGTACVAHALAGPEAARAATERAETVARRFIDMVFIPQQMRALMGDDPAELAASATMRIDEAIALLDAGALLSGFD